MKACQGKGGKSVCAECNDESVNQESLMDEESAELIRKLENAYKIYKLSELFLQDVGDDYGKQKIARLRFAFARHELLTLMQEAREKGIQWENSEMLRKYFYPDS